MAPAIRTTTFGILLSALLLCSCITEEPAGCPNRYLASFIYDMNASEGDAFARRVTSVTLYAFEAESGRLAFVGSCHGGELAGKDYRMNLGLSPGTYDIVAWGGLHGNNSFAPPPPSPEEIGDVAVTILSEGESSSLLAPVYHGRTRATFTDNYLTGIPDDQTVEVSLIKDTNDISITLISTEGAEISEHDFSASISCDNARMEFDNSVNGNMLYRPWTVKVIDDYRGLLPTPYPSSPGVATMKAHVSELSVGRLTAESHSALDVFRNSDGKRIIHIPLEDNLLLFRKEHHASMSDQEYLDRFDTFDISFILAGDNGWNPATAIYINEWAVMPVQFIDW